MKKLTYLLLVAFLATNYCIAQTKYPEPIVTKVSQSNQDDRVFMLDYYQQTLDSLKTSVAGLTEEQLTFKPAADRWSISECLEHIVATEQMLFEMTKKGMDAPANPEDRVDIKVTDEQVIAGMTDRNYKAKAPEQLRPEGKYKDAQTAIADLEKGRESILEYIKSVSLEDLRNHVGKSPMGSFDSYQSFLYIPGHTARHTAQIEELKADENFPKTKK